MRRLISILRPTARFSRLLDILDIYGDNFFQEILKRSRVWGLDLQKLSLVLVSFWCEGQCNPEGRDRHWLYKSSCLNQLPWLIYFIQYFLMIWLLLLKRGLKLRGHLGTVLLCCTSDRLKNRKSQIYFSWQMWDDLSNIVLTMTL